MTRYAEINHHIPTPTYGLELEKAFTSIEGDPYLVGDRYFEYIQKCNHAASKEATLKTIDGRVVGVATKRGDESLDSSFAHGESSTGPVTEEEGGLRHLHRIVTMQYTHVLDALTQDGAGVLDMSNHPLTPINPETYKKHVVPKPVYGYLRGVRGWNHAAGINAKSQNSPSVGIEAPNAVEALNATIGFGAAFVAMYANSPFEEGKLTGLKESRLAIWNNMFKDATFAGDARLHQMPPEPFGNMRDYFNWMFGPDTAMYFVVVDKDGLPPKNEKGDVSILHVDQNPTLLEFLKQDQWNATDFHSRRKATVAPHMGHFAMHQFTQFAGARIRYGLKDADGFEIGRFTDAMAKSGNEVDELFAEEGAYFYIEGRDPGTNFPGQQLQEEVGGRVSASVIMSASALHTGLIRNSAMANRVLESYGWDTLRGLRDEAIKHGLDATYNGENVKELCDDLLSLAAAGLTREEEWMLEYPDYVMSSDQNGADRAIARYNELEGDPRDKIKKIVCERVITLV